MGDFNAHHADWFSQTIDPRAATRGEDISQQVNTSNLCLLNQDSPTRVPRNGAPSSPDLALVSAHLALDFGWSTVTTLSSDHLPILITSTVDAPPTQGPKRTFINYKKANWPDFTAETEVLITALPAPTSCSCGLRDFNKALKTASKHHIPGGFRRNIIPGLSPEAKAAIARRDNLRASTPLDPSLPGMQAEVDAIICEAARLAWQETIANCDPRANQSRFWALLKSLSGKRNTTAQNQPITFRDRVLCKAGAIAKGFCHQFTSVPIATPSISNRRARRSFKRRHPIDPNFTPFSPDIVAKAIQAAGTSTAVGPDGLTILHLKHLGVAGISYLTSLCNLSVAGPTSQPCGSWPT